MSIEPKPITAAWIGGMAVPFVEENYGLTLDYSIPSLGHVDAVLADLRRDQEFEKLQPLLFSLGCYVGEVLVRNAGAHWKDAEPQQGKAKSTAPIVIEMPDGRAANPVGRVFKAFQLGGNEDMTGFYRAMAGSGPPVKRRRH